MLRIERSVWNDMIGYCRSALPDEACGVLLCESGDETSTIRHWRPIPNRASLRDRAFAFDPAAWIRVWYEADAAGRVPLGIFHSHPGAPAVPSPEDAAGNGSGLPTYWIVSFVPQGGCDVRAYTLAESSNEAARYAVSPFRIV